MVAFLVEILVPVAAFVMTLLGTYFVKERRLGDEALRTGPELCKISFGVVIITLALGPELEWFRTSRIGQDSRSGLYLALLLVALVFSYMYSFKIFHDVCYKRPARTLVPELRKWRLKVAWCQLVGVSAWVVTALVIGWGEHK